MKIYKIEIYLNIADCQNGCCGSDYKTFAKEYFSSKKIAKEWVEEYGFDIDDNDIEEYTVDDKNWKYLVSDDIIDKYNEREPYKVDLKKI